MTQSIKLKRSSTQANIPTPAQLELGEVGINTYDGKMFIKKNDGLESIIQIGDISYHEDAANPHNQYVTHTEADSAYLGINDTATNSTLFGGLNPNQFLRSDSDDTFNGNLTISSSGTIGSANFDNGWLKIGNSGDGLAFDANEIFAVNELHILTTNGDINLNPNSGIAKVSNQRIFTDSYHPNADILTTARTISLSGDASGSISFDGSSAVSIPVVIADDSHNHVISNVDGLQTELDEKLDLTGGIMSGKIRFNTDDLSNGFEWNVNSDAAGIRFKNDGDSDSNSNFNFFTKDNGNEYFKFSHTIWDLPDLDYMDIKNGQIFINGDIFANASQTGSHDAETNYLSGGDKVFHETFHPNADKLTTARTISLSGDVSGSVSFDGSGDADIPVVIYDNSHTHNYTVAVDNRDVKPNNTGLNNVHGVRPFFTTLAGMTGEANTDYQDLLVLDTYDNTSGGNVNAITFDKSFKAVRIWQASQDATTWGSSERLFGDNYHPEADKLTNARTISLSGDASGSVSFDGSGNVSIPVVIADDSHNHDSRYLRNDVNERTEGGLVIGGQVSTGSTDFAGYRNTGTNLKLEGDSEGTSGIFFESTKNGTNINHPSDYGYIQYHAYGIDGTTGESNRLVIGVANDTTDNVVLQTPYKDGLKASYVDSTSGTGGAEHTIWHAGNDGSGSGLDADLLDNLDSTQFLRSDVSDSMAGDLTVSGDIIASGDSTISTGVGSGSVAMTMNDSQGNSNLTFNHIDGIPDQNGNAARISVNTDVISNASIIFELKSNVTSGVTVDTPQRMEINESGVVVEGDLTVNGGDITLGGTGRIQGIDTVSAGTDAANKDYVDTEVAANSGDVDFKATLVKSLTLTTAWQNVGISGTDIPTGTHIFQLHADDHAVAGGHYNERYSATISWLSASTNDTGSDEIVLHRAGHAANNGAIYLRTQREASGVLQLQIAAGYATSGASNYTFSFRQMI